MTRARELAEQAWRRVSVLGHEPVAAIEAAIHQALDQMGTMDLRSIEALPRAQRRVARALVAGPATAMQVSRALEMIYQQARTNLQKLLRKGLVAWERGRGGHYRLIGVNKPPSSAEARLLAHLAEHGPTRVQDLAPVVGLTPRETSDMCCWRVRRHRLHRVRPGVYALPAARRGRA